MPFYPSPQLVAETQSDEELFQKVEEEHKVHFVLSLPKVHLPGAQELSQAEHYYELFKTLIFKKKDYIINKKINFNIFVII